MLEPPTKKESTHSVQRMPPRPPTPHDPPPRPPARADTRSLNQGPSFRVARFHHFKAIVVLVKVEDDLASGYDIHVCCIARGAAETLQSRRNSFSDKGKAGEQRRRGNGEERNQDAARSGRSGTHMDFTG